MGLMAGVGQFGMQSSTATATQKSRRHDHQDAFVIVKIG